MMILSRLDFRNRFTTTEKVRIYQAAGIDLRVRIWLDDLAVADDVDTEYAPTIEAVQALEAAGLLDEGRTAADILNAPPASGSLGGFSVGDVVTVKPPFSSAFPGEYRIEGVEAESLVVYGSSFSPDYLEHA